VRLEPEPASASDRAEHDPLGKNQRHLYRCPRITAALTGQEVMG
jgi:hypothetical protein